LFGTTGRGLISGLILLGKGLGFELGNCFWKRPTFLLLTSGSALEKFAAIVNPENKPTKVNWTLSWPSALEICGKTEQQARFFPENMSFFHSNIFGLKKYGMPKNLVTIVNLPNIAGALNNLGNVWYNSEPSY